MEVRRTAWLALLAAAWMGGSPSVAQPVPSTGCPATAVEAPDWPGLEGLDPDLVRGDGERVFLRTRATPPETGWRIAVYREDAGLRVLEAKLGRIPGGPSFGEPDRPFAIDGQRVAFAVGASVHVHRREGTNWLPDGWADLADTGLDVHRVQAVALEGDRLATLVAEGLTYRERVVVFERAGDEWLPTADFWPEDLDSSTPSSRSLLLSEGHVLLGVPWTADEPYGRLRIFGESGGVWEERARLGADGQSRGAFGQVFTKAAGRLYVTEPRFDSRDRGDFGRVVIFEGAGASWEQVDEVRAALPSYGEQLGHSLCVVGDRLLVGAASHSEGNWLEDMGVAWYFERIDGAWRMQARIDRPAFKCGSCPIVMGVALAPGGVVVVSGRDPETGALAEHGRFFETSCLRDEDEDGLETHEDPCPALATGLESDVDGDGLGAGCDSCPEDANPYQEDLDGDGLGDACDPDVDDDGLDDDEDPCPRDPETGPCARCEVQAFTRHEGPTGGSYGHRTASAGGRVAVAFAWGVGPGDLAVEILEQDAGRFLSRQVIDRLAADVAGRAIRTDVEMSEDHLLVELDDSVLARRWDGAGFVPDGEFAGRAPFALAGDRALVSVWDGLAPSVVRHFRREASGWVLVEEIPGYYSEMATRPGLLVLGRPDATGAAGFDAGRIRILELRGERFEEVASFEGEAAGARLGSSLAVDGPRLLASDATRVRSWLRTASGWVEEGELVPFDTVAAWDEEEGPALALRGGLAAIGQAGADGAGTPFGLTLYRRSGVGWEDIGHAGPREASVRASPSLAFVGPWLVAAFTGGAPSAAGGGRLAVLRLPCLDDTDGDGLADPVDPCPWRPGRDSDPDHDGVGEGCDNCRLFGNPNQRDGDGDGLGDACEFAWGDLAPAGAPDGLLNVADVIRLLRLAVDLEPLGLEDLARGDVAPAVPHPLEPGRLCPASTFAGSLSVGDAVVLLRVVVGLEVFGAPW